MKESTKVNTITINDETQLTNSFVKLVQSEIYHLEFRLKHEVNCKDSKNKKVMRLKREIFSEFRRRVNALSNHYIEQKANFDFYNKINEQVEFPFLTESQEFEDSELTKI